MSIYNSKILIKLLVIFAICMFCSDAFAFDLDETVDDEIRKNYNSTKLIEDTGTNNNALQKNIENNEVIDENLPSLPNIIKSETVTKQSVTKTSEVQKIKTPIKKISHFSIKKGKSVYVKSTSAISDWQQRGTKVRFKLSNNNSKIKLPANAVFNAEIIESHQPQITCNGGLVVIRVTSINLDGNNIPVNAYVTLANGKHIFFNNIKGERTYLKTMWKKGDWGRTLFNKMLNLTINLGGEGSTLVLSPFPIVYGTVCLGLNALTSPITAFFSKGGHVSIPANSNFKIKFEDEVIY